VTVRDGWRAGSGDPPAAVELAFRREWAAVLATLIRHVGDFQLAEDAVQDAFAAALATWPRDGVPANPGAWLTVAARRRAIDRLRRKQAYCRAKERYQVYLNEQPAAAQESHSHGDDISRSDLRNFLHRRLNVLPRHQREALELAFFAGMSHREIASVTRAPLGTVKTRLELGLQKLTQSLRPLRHKI